MDIFSARESTVPTLQIKINLFIFLQKIEEKSKIIGFC